MDTQETEPSEAQARAAVIFGKLIGAGSCRKVYRHGNSKWAYKENDSSRFNPHSQNLGSNGHEYMTYLAFKDSDILPEGVKIPEMRMVGDYIAVEYISGQHPENASCYAHRGFGYHDYDCDGSCWVQRIEHLPFRDLHYRNVMMTDNGDIYLIDLGHGS